MANHGFVTTRKRLKADDVEKKVIEYLGKKFKNTLRVERWCERDNGGMVAGWTVDHLSDDPYFGFQFYLTKSTMLEFRHPTNRYMWWVQSLLVDEMARWCNGLISDEGCDGKWKPERKEKYPTFRVWLRFRVSGRKLPADFLLAEYLSWTSSVPKDVWEASEGIWWKKMGKGKAVGFTLEESR